MPDISSSKKKKYRRDFEEQVREQHIFKEYAD